MFESSVYANRRRVLLERMAGANGIAVFVGNADAAMNYRGNDYKFRQDSSFLYYWGVDEPWFAAVLDLDNGQECLYGNDVDIDDIIWMGPQPSVASKGAAIGCQKTAPLAEFDNALTPVQVDGDFGPTTARAVRQYQSNNGLTADGVVGERTWESIYRSFAAAERDLRRDDVRFGGRSTQAAGRYAPPVRFGQYPGYELELGRSDDGEAVEV